ncbi:MAG: PDDEXK nuclease domain-containing protein [Candidatus Sumerlaeota bacterium]|nr:PDDEXK nuclease domain-containing protein [Candidatus Sumerlaeota bacterium]
MNFEALVQAIAHVHQQLQDRAAKAVNISLTARNWLIGWHIVEFEQRGEDRAVYGQRLIEGLSERLQELTIPSCEARRLYLYRDFYAAYPHIRETLSPVLHSALPSVSPGVTEQVEILRTLSAESAGQLQHQQNQSFEIVRTPSAQLGALPHLLVDRLSYSHFELLTALDAPLKRAFYEIECIKGGWSVRELKRQIASLYFERSGLSLDKEALSRLANGKIKTQASVLTFRDPYIFNFAGLRPSEVLPESDLEAALLNHLREFLLELGHGFCFEACQKWLVIGGEYFFVDLVFYHRVLKCHVLVELKADEFRHEYLGQLNTYVSFYRANQMTDGDQPPIGLLLCTGKNHALVEYALAGMDNRLFVSKYQLELPKSEDLQRYLDNQRKQIECSQAEARNGSG